MNELKYLHSRPWWASVPHPARAHVERHYMHLVHLAEGYTERDAAEAAYDFTMGWMTAVSIMIRATHSIPGQP